MDGGGSNLGGHTIISGVKHVKVIIDHHRGPLHPFFLFGSGSEDGIVQAVQYPVTVGNSQADAGNLIIPIEAL